MSETQPTTDGAQPTPQQTSPGVPAQQGQKLPTTQEEFDRVVNERLSRERAKFKDYDALRTKAADYDKLQESMLSDQEKAVKDASQKAQAETAAKYQSRLVAADVRAAAAGLNFRDPEDALKHLSVTDLLNGDDVDHDKVKAALDDLVKAKPYLTNADPKPSDRRPARIRRSAEDGDTNTKQQKPRTSAQLLRTFNRGD